MNPEDRSFTRRTMLATGASGAATSLLVGGSSVAQPPSNEVQDIYQRLGVRKLINAAGTITAIGGSLMPPEVLAAWNAAAASFIDLLELQDRVGERIAQLIGVDAALVTTGAAGSIVLGTAAAVTLRDATFINRLPMTLQDDLQVIRQKSHRQCYDNQVKSCGVRLVDVESRDDLLRAINDRTVLMFSYNVHEGDGQIPQADWLEIARQHRIPTLIDAAADTPPVETLSGLNRTGFDMVAFSGGKALRGPQDAGLLLGRKDLIAQAKLNTSPRCGTIGRALKVSKEDMVAMCAAVERFVRLDHQAETREFERRMTTIEQAIKNIPSVTTERIIPPIANRVPHLLIHWDEGRLAITPAQVKQMLLAGDPPIATARVHGTGERGFLVSVFMLQNDEDTLVGRRIAEILRSHDRSK